MFHFVYFLRVCDRSLFKHFVRFHVETPSFTYVNIRVQELWETAAQKQRVKERKSKCTTSTAHLKSSLERDMKAWHERPAHKQLSTWRKHMPSFT